MLSVVLLAFARLNPQPGRRRDALARSLASLVDACVQGLVADAVLLGPGSAELTAIAEDAGAAHVEAASQAEGLPLALAAVRHSQILLLEAGHAVERGFVDEVRDALSFGDPTRPMVLRAAPDSLLTRLAPNLARPVGLIAPRESLLSAGASDIAALARRLGGRDLSTRARRAV